MTSSSEQRTLGDYFTLQRGKTYKSRLLGQSGPVLLGLATINRHGGFRADSLRTYGGDSPDAILVQPGQLYLSLKDVTQSADLLGAVARFPLSQSVGRLTQDTVRLVPRVSSAPLSFLYWLLRTPHYRSYCRAHATGTTNLGLARGDFLAYPVPAFTASRRCIVDVLESLERKIELNHRMSETLDEMARAIFKSWFVDFDPVRAKAAEKPTGLSSELDRLFPAKLVPSELGEIPEGWTTGSILAIADLISGGTPKTGRDDYWGGDIPWASAKDVSQCSGLFLVSTERRITEAGLCGSSTKMVPADATVVVARGATTGRVALFASEMAMNQTCYALTSSTGTPFALSCLLRHWIPAIVSSAHGSVFDTITTRTLRNTAVVLPSVPALRAFETLAAPMFNRVRAATLESRSLAELRDLLLPKLVSGELRVPDAEKYVESVT